VERVNYYTVQLHILSCLNKQASNHVYLWISWRWFNILHGGYIMHRVHKVSQMVWL